MTSIHSQVMKIMVSRLVVALELLVVTSLHAFPQNYPIHPVKIIVPTAPGGAIDTAARLVGEKLQTRWGQLVVVENRPGASMRIGAEVVQKAVPDGYTLLVAHDGTMVHQPDCISRSSL
jgi:tripartite-type tricarboxylate transporter receptor subunit TctC